jgi:hypothetical protein
MHQRNITEGREEMTEHEYYKVIAELQAECLTKDKMIYEFQYLIKDLKYQIEQLEKALND